MFSVSDLAVESMRLLCEVPGITEDSPPRHRPWGAYSCWLRDPDGNLFSLVQPPPETAQP